MELPFYERELGFFFNELLKKVTNLDSYSSEGSHSASTCPLSYANPIRSRLRSLVTILSLETNPYAANSCLFFFRFAI